MPWPVRYGNRYAALSKSASGPCQQADQLVARAQRWQPTAPMSVLAPEGTAPPSPRQPRREIMGEFIDKAKAAGNDIAGNVKEAIGKGTDNANLTAEGQAQQAKADAQRLKGDVKGALGDKV